MSRSGPARTGRRLLVPEVVQISDMDCGPASLKCLLEGFGIRVSYGRLREACQTDVDGTSIDTMEEIACDLGLDAEQVMLPVDHVLRDESPALPALIVVRLPTGATHFVVAWRRHGPLMQLMDPATGRRFPGCRRFLEEIFVHTMAVPAASFREWAGSPSLLDPLRGRLKDLGVDAETSISLIEAALSDPGPGGIAGIDAATRMVADLKASGGIASGREATQLLTRVAGRLGDGAASPLAVVPEAYWTATPAAPDPAEGEAQVMFRGAVLVHVRGRKAAAAGPGAAPASSATAGRAQLSPALKAALDEPPPRPGRDLLALLRVDGLLTPAAIAAALALAAAGVVLEALLFRSLAAFGGRLGLTFERLGALGAVMAVAAILLFLDLPLTSGLLGIGRRLETRLRAAFLLKIPRLGDRYLSSRLTSDMAGRSHAIHQVRLLPEQGGEFLRVAFELLFTTVGIALLAPSVAPLAAVSAVLGVALPLAVQPILAERDLRVRNHTGAISRFYLDALLGLVAIRAHGAERSIRREHQNRLAEWARAAISLLRAQIAVEAAVFLTGFGLAAWLLLDYLGSRADAGPVLLLVYWAVNLPVLGRQLGVMAQQYPTHRNATLQLLEPLGAPDETPVESAPDAVPARARASASGVAVAFERVNVTAAGHTILDEVDLSIPAGSHVAIVGPSGAGKSSLVGLLLGWHQPARGRILVDGESLQGRRLEALRRETAWVDPAVALWNRPLIDNLYYGAGSSAGGSLAAVLEAAEIRSLLERLPEGLQTTLGEGGGLVSGGEGQRVRLGRAFLRPGVRLVILDEPFRGLERERRSLLLERARLLWRGATLLCITHDVGETLGFERVLVIEKGRVIEDGAPRDLRAAASSRYRSLLDAEQAVREGLWTVDAWRRVRLDGGRLAAGDGDGRRAGREP